MKSLHISNIANMAYGYAKMLNRYSLEARVVCHDIKHLMSQPEWEDLELDPANFPDEANFFNNTQDFGNYVRPEWFVQDHISFRDFIDRAEQRLAIAPTAKLSRQIKFLKFSAELSQKLPAKWRTLGKRFFHERFGLSEGMRQGSSMIDWQTLESNLAIYSSAIKNLPQHYGFDWSITDSDVNAYHPHARWLNHYLKDTDVIFAYAAAPIYPMLLRKRPTVAVEIGTIRELPFDGTTWGRMIGLGYQQADHVVITNPDNIDAARKLSLQSYSFCPHPVDEDVFKPSSEIETSIRKRLRNQYGVERLFIAPARQNWKLKGNDQMLKGFAGALTNGLSAQLLIPIWGQDIEASRKLVAELGIENRVSWIAPMSERSLVRYYQAVDAVLDQFVLGVFGLTTPKAMACGKPVLCAYSPKFNRWCFPEDPPLLHCNSADTIQAQLLRFKGDAASVSNYGVEARKWIIQYHSSEAAVSSLRLAAETASLRFEKSLLLAS